MYLPEEQEECAHYQLFLPSQLIGYFSAEDTKSRIEKEGRSCLLVPANLMNDQETKTIVDKHVERFGRIDVLINNASKQIQCKDLGTRKTLVIEWSANADNINSRNRTRQRSLDI